MHFATLTANFVMACDNLALMSLTGNVVQDQHHLLIQVQITIIQVGQVREMSSTSFDHSLFFFCVCVCVCVVVVVFFGLMCFLFNANFHI